MLYGHPPFETDGNIKMYEKILRQPVEFARKPRISSDAVDIISSLLRKIACKRLGSGLSGAFNVKTHKWFNTINWGLLLEQRLEAPVIPNIKDEFDVSNYDEVFETEGLDDEDTTMEEFGEKSFLWCQDF